SEGHVRDCETAVAGRLAAEPRYFLPCSPLPLARKTRAARLPRWLLEHSRSSVRILRLMRTCAEHGVPPLAYLTDVLRELGAGWDSKHPDRVLPHRWSGTTTFTKKGGRSVAPAAVELTH